MRGKGQTAEGERLKPYWEIDPRKIGQCHLADFFVDEIVLFEGLAGLLRDLGCLADVPGEYPKVAEISIDGVLAIAQTIDRGAQSLCEKVEALDREMCSRGWATYSMSRAAPSRDRAQPIHQPGKLNGETKREGKRGISRPGASSNGKRRKTVLARP